MQITSYRIPCPAELTAAVVCDLHEDDPTEVLETLRQIQPQLILCPGDILERQLEGRDPRNLTEFSLLHRFLRKAALTLDFLLSWDNNDGNRENGYRFLREAAEIAPVILSKGNHEWVILPEDEALLNRLGIKILDNEDIEYADIRIGGLSSATNLEWVTKFSQKDGFKLLLCHHPEYYPKFLKGLDFDLIIAGHAHGGQISLFGRGLFSSSQGFFPKYCRGMYDNKLLVSAGCANTASFPRWGNPCEVVELHLGTDC